MVANGEMPFPSPTPHAEFDCERSVHARAGAALDPVGRAFPVARPLRRSSRAMRRRRHLRMLNRMPRRKKAEEELDKVAAENGVKRPKEINTRPFKDLLMAGQEEARSKGELNLDGVIELTVEADRSPDGKLTNAKVTDKRGDKVLETTALEFIAALSDSGVLVFLEDAKHLRVTVKLDQTTVEIVAATEVDSEERARQLERTYGLMIVLGRLAKQGKDEEVYYNHTQVSSKEKEVSVKFAMPRAEMGAMLSKYAAEK